MHRLLLLWFFLALSFGPVPWAKTGVTAREIEPKADEWTRIGDNDTIPAGMHVRIDMTTGEKWVKQIDKKEDENSGLVALAVSSNGETDKNDKKAAHVKRDNEPSYDYDRMHATLAQLPPEEHERMGLPELPTPDTKNPEQTAAERKAFEARMKIIWEHRQQVLRRIQQEQLIDLPEVLKTNIRYLQEYWNGTGDRSAQQIKEDLVELEFLVTDVDMARDFYTLQGWPWILTLLTQPHNETLTQEQVENIQAAAAWVVGTAVQNTGEFRPWVVEPIVLPNGTAVSALDSLMQLWTTGISANSIASLPQRVLYALSACLRGNPLAQHVQHQKGFPQRLQQDLRDTPADTNHGRKQILRILQLGSDLLMEWDSVLTSIATETKDPTNDTNAAVVTEFRNAWTTTDWCTAVLGKIHVVARADKRLPILDAWFDSCQNTWDPVRLRDLLMITDDNGDSHGIDDDTAALRTSLLEKMSTQVS